MTTPKDEPLKPSTELIGVALAAVAKHRDRLYPTGEDRAALCSAAIILADAWNTRRAFPLTDAEKEIVEAAKVWARKNPNDARLFDAVKALRSQKTIIKCDELSRRLTSHDKGDR